jgi:hypothetical protein
MRLRSSHRCVFYVMLAIASLWCARSRRFAVVAVSAYLNMTKQNKRLGTEKNPAFSKVHIWYSKDVFFFVIVFCSFY